LRFSIVRDRILSLKNQHAVTGNTNQCLEKLLKVFAEHKEHVTGELQRLEKRISCLEENAQDFTEEKRELDERIFEIEENASRFTAVQEQDSSTHLRDLQTDMHNLQLLVDDLDNRTRVWNVVVHDSMVQEKLIQ
jgi:chromosome segregation ATPase